VPPLYLAWAGKLKRQIVSNKGIVRRIREIPADVL